METRRRVEDHRGQVRGSEIEQPGEYAEFEIEQPVGEAEFEIEQPIGEANEIEQPVGEAEAFVPRSVPPPGRRGGGRGRGPQNVGVAVAGRGQRGGGRGRGPSRVAVGEPGNEELGEPPPANWAGGVRPGAWSAGDRDPWTGVERGAAGQAVKRQVTSAARIFLENKRLNEELRTRRLQMWTEQLDQNDAEQRTEEERLEAEADLRWNEAVAAETAREAEAAALAQSCVGISVSGGGGGGDASRKASAKKTGKTQLCRIFGLQGFCPLIPNCRFAHGERELVNAEDS